MASFTSGNLGVNKLRTDNGDILTLDGPFTALQALRVNAGGTAIESAGASATSVVCDSADETCFDTDPLANQTVAGTLNPYLASESLILTDRSAAGGGAQNVNKVTGGNFNSIFTVQGLASTPRVVSEDLTSCSESTIATTATITAPLLLVGDFTERALMPLESGAASNALFENRTCGGTLYVMYKAASSTVPYYDEIDFALTLGADPGGPYPSTLPIAASQFNVKSNGASTTGIVSYALNTATAGQLGLDITNDTAGNLRACGIRTIRFIGPQLA